jgi:hypothetical protein
MTLLRKLALKISDAVVRFTSPGCKEWAEGLARELAFIRSDWAALAWALGSTRVLLDRREAPITSLADIPAAMQRPMWRVGLTLVYSACLNWTLWFGLGRPPYLSWEVVVFWSFLDVIQELRQARRLKAYARGDALAYALAYKKQLEARCSLKRQSIGFLFILVCAFYVLKDGTNPIFDGLAGLVWLGAIVQVLRSLPRNRMRLQRLNALLAEKTL